MANETNVPQSGTTQTVTFDVKEASARIERTQNSINTLRQSGDEDSAKLLEAKLKVYEREIKDYRLKSLHEKTTEKLEAFATGIREAVLKAVGTLEADETIELSILIDNNGFKTGLKSKQMKVAETKEGDETKKRPGYIYNGKTFKSANEAVEAYATENGLTLPKSNFSAPRWIRDKKLEAVIYPETV